MANWAMLTRSCCCSCCWNREQGARGRRQEASGKQREAAKVSKGPNDYELCL